MKSSHSSKTSSPFRPSMRRLKSLKLISYFDIISWIFESKYRVFAEARSSTRFFKASFSSLKMPILTSSVMGSKASLETSMVSEEINAMWILHLVFRWLSKLPPPDRQDAPAHTGAGGGEGVAGGPSTARPK